MSVGNILLALWVLLVSAVYLGLPGVPGLVIGIVGLFTAIFLLAGTYLRH